MHRRSLKVYQENGNLAPFVAHYTDRDALIPDVDETALIQVLNQLSPVVIVDESHNAQSELSIEMLRNLNPSFVLDLTATPKSNSNIISIVDARELKKENMVKLPVIIYNRRTKDDVLVDAIQLRAGIEQQARVEMQQNSTYIRPIVLFQAQPKALVQSYPAERRKDMCIDRIYQLMNRLDFVGASDLRKYIQRIVDQMNSDQLAQMESALPAYAAQIKQKINGLADKYREEKFYRMIDTGEITVEPGYTFPKTISPGLSG